MPEYLSPGDYIQEVERGPRRIEGIATSVGAFLGETRRGSARPRLVTSFSDYLRHFGGSFGEAQYMPDALSGFFDNGGKRAYVCRIVGTGAVAAQRGIGELNIEAIGPGSWGNRIFVKLTAAETEVSNVRFRLQIAYWEEATANGLYLDPFDETQTPATAAAITEDFDNLEWSDTSSADHYSKRLHGASALVAISVASTVESSVPPTASFAPLAGGLDGTVPALENYEGEDPNPAIRTGLAVLQLAQYRDVALLVAPGAPDDVVGALIKHCEQSRSRFAIVDAARNLSNANSLAPRAKWDSSYAAYYYPWITIRDPQSGLPRLVPPSGHVAGIYVRTDIERGVWKSPANELVRGAVGLEFYVNNQTQEALDVAGVNAIRQFPERGIRIWGARTLSTNALWKYVSVRRLFNFLEQSICDGTKWTAFEPNDEALWERVSDVIRQFLRVQWRSGALLGAKEDEAFFVTCDRRTMTQDDVSKGRLICEIGVAVVRPAEFVIFRIFQSTVATEL